MTPHSTEKKENIICYVVLRQMKIFKMGKIYNTNYYYTKALSGL